MILRLATALAALTMFGSSATADAPRVAADILPVHSLVARVMEGAGTPDLILAPGASPHSHAMRPSEAAALDAAGVVFWVGEELTPWLADPISTLAGDARVVALLDDERTLRLGLRDAHDADQPEEDGHDHEGTDPHAWLDPENARAWLGVIAATLAEADPGNEALYRANAAAGAAEISAAEQSVRDRLEQAGQPGYAVYHDAYQYFEKRFGLDQAVAISPGDASAPGPRRIAELHAALTEAGVACVLAEPGANPALIGTVVDGQRAAIRTIDPAGSGLEPGPGLYVALIEDLADTLLSCASKPE